MVCGGQEREDVVVTFRLVKRIDTFLLIYSDPVIVALPFLNLCKFAYVVTFKVGAGRQQNVCEFRFSLAPDRLHHHEFKLGAIVHFHPSVCRRQGAGQPGLRAALQPDSADPGTVHDWVIGSGHRDEPCNTGVLPPSRAQ